MDYSGIIFLNSMFLALVATSTYQITWSNSPPTLTTMSTTTTSEKSPVPTYVIVIIVALVVLVIISIIIGIMCYRKGANGRAFVLELYRFKTLKLARTKMWFIQFVSF